MKLFLLAAVLLPALSGTACFAGSGAANRGDYNVVMILMETLRPDHLGCYGYRRETSPNIDRLAAESAVFENAFAQSSQSLISAASVFTGLYPPSHGVTRADKRLSPDAATLAGELKKRGYKTAAFTGGFFLNHTFGLNIGFETYDDSKDFGTLHDTVPGAQKWLRENREKKFFLLVHGYDAHAPYRAPRQYLDKFSTGYDGPLSGLPLDYYLADRIYKNVLYEDFRLKKKTATLQKWDIDYVISQYDGAVLYADSYAGRLLSELESLGLKDKTIVLFAASSGEALMEHGTIISSFHGELYDEGIHVPLIIRAPGGGASRIKAEVQLIDVMPTVLDLLGFAVPGAVQGISLRPALERKEMPAKDRLVYAQTLSLNTSSSCIGARKYPWKLLLKDGRRELFNLAADPKEQKNVADERPDILKSRIAELDRLLKAMPRRKAEKSLRPLAIVSQRMKALGYWWMDRPRIDFWGERHRGKKADKR